MNSEFALIQYNDWLPAKIEIKQGNINEPCHWHKEIELLYVLQGEIQAAVNGVSRTLQADAFLLMNTAENHSLLAENAACLVLDISYEFIQQYPNLSRTIPSAKS